MDDLDAAVDVDSTNAAIGLLAKQIDDLAERIEWLEHAPGIPPEDFHRWLLRVASTHYLVQDIALIENNTALTELFRGLMLWHRRATAKRASADDYVQWQFALERVLGPSLEFWEKRELDQRRGVGVEDGTWTLPVSLTVPEAPDTVTDTNDYSSHLTHKGS